MNLSVFGLGYVGCVSAVSLARAGHQVVGVDVNPDKVAQVAAGRAPIVEPGVADPVAKAVREGRLVATTDAVSAVERSDVALICVGTPADAGGRPDTTAVATVVAEIARALGGRRTGFTAILRSTVLPGTTERILEPIRQAAAGGAFRGIAANPEFMREGSALEDFEHPAFVLAGSDDPRAISVVREIHAHVPAPFVATSFRTAEAVKYASNTFHALKVRFANEIADVFASLGADTREALKIFAMDRALNLSEAYLEPGFAFGGSCLPKDVRAIVRAAADRDVQVPVLAAILPSNDAHIRRAIDAVLRLPARRIAVVPLAFKPETDDLRGSPMVAVVQALVAAGRDVRVFDRAVHPDHLVGANRRFIEAEIPNLTSRFCADIETLVADADALVIGASTADTRRAIALARPGCAVVDVTHSTSHDIKQWAPAPIGR